MVPVKGDLIDGVGHRKTRMILPAAALVLLAAEICLLAIIAFCFLVLRVTWGAPHREAAGVGDPVWTLLGGVTLVFGSGLLWFAVRAARQHEVIATTLVGLTCLYGIMAMALRVVDLGGHPEANIIQSVELLGFSGTQAKRPPSKPTAAGAGNTERGKPLFLATCAACHGPSGQGIAGTAPAYSETEFVRTSDELTLARMIQQGRPMTAPDNRSKRAMPAQGGNPFLTPQNVRDIAVFIKSLSSDNSNSTSNAATASPSQQLPNWVVPSAAMSSLGLTPEASARWTSTQLSLAEELYAPQVAARRLGLLTGLFRTWSVLNLLHLAGAAIGLLLLLGGALSRTKQHLSCLQVSAVALWWNLGTVTWFLFVGLFIVIG